MQSSVSLFMHAIPAGPETLQGSGETASGRRFGPGYSTSCKWTSPNSCSYSLVQQIEALREYATPEGNAGASGEALDSLTSEQRHNLYGSFRLEVLAHPNDATELVLGDMRSYDEVCTKESLSRSQTCTTSPTACRSRAA
jgi:hypothetical protein